MARIVFTDGFITSTARLPPPGKRSEFRDALVPGLCLRVTEKGHRSFVMVARFPLNPKAPSRRFLGEYGAMSIDQARDEARAWHALLRQGVDPKTDRERRMAELQREQVTFGHVAEQYLERHAKSLKKHDEASRIVRVEFMSRWAKRPITTITGEECAAAIRAIVKRGHSATAHNSLAYLKRLFSWAIEGHEFGVTSSPCDKLRPVGLIGARVNRERTLTDDELKAVWEAADRLGYPSTQIVRLLILTGARLREIGNLSWPEVDLDKKLITIPSSRMKGKQEHQIPLAPVALGIMQSLHKWPKGDWCFTANSGRTAFVGFQKLKVRLDAACGVTGWVLHDLRRSMRSHLSALPIEDRVRESMIAHAQVGMDAVYNRWRYTDEKRRGFTLWEQRLASIVNPTPPAEVIELLPRRPLKRRA